MSNEKVLDKDTLIKISQYPSSLIAVLLSQNSTKWLNNLKYQEFLNLLMLEILGKHYNINTLNDFVKEYLELKISVDKTGREDLIKIAKSSVSKILQSFYEKMKTFSEGGKL